MHRKVLRLAIVSALTCALAALTACPDREVATVNPNQSRQQGKDIPVTLNRDIDILFVVDNSPSMAPLEADLVTNFPKFINVLQNIPGGLPNLHIGVVDEDVGQNGATFSNADPHCNMNPNGQDGALQNKPCGQRTNPFQGDYDYGQHPFMCDTSCTGPSDPWIEDLDNGKTTNFSGSLASTFSCIANLGDWGCGFEMHLESMRRAFDYMRNPQNKGFLRKDAYLAIIILANEDDCSTQNPAMLDPNKTSTFGAYASYRCTKYGVVCQPDGDAAGPRQNCMPRENSMYMYHVQDYVNFVKGLKSDPNKIIVAGIDGPSTPFAVGSRMVGQNSLPKLNHSCTFSNSVYADPAVRINWFLKQFPGRNTLQTICTDDFSPALIQIAQLLKQVLGDPCIEGDLLDSSGKPVAGTNNQPDCEVTDVQNKGQPNETQTLIPHCSSPTSTSRCWYAKQDTADCSKTITHLALVINGKAPANDDVVADCSAQ